MPRKHISQLQNSKIANSESWLQAIIKFPQNVPLFFHYSQFHKASLLGLPSHTQTHTTHTPFFVWKAFWKASAEMVLRAM